MHLSRFGLIFLKVIVVYFLSSSVSLAQTVSLNGDLEGLEYSAKITYKHDCFQSEPLTRATLHSVYINSFTYKGKTYRGNDLGEVTFPINVEDGYLKVTGRVRIDKNSYIGLPPAHLSLKIGGGGHAVMADGFHISKDDLKSLGMKKCDEWIPRAHEIRDLKVLGGNFSHKRSLSWRSDLESLVEKKLKEEKEKRMREEKLNSIQKQIEQTDDPDEKIALLKESKEYRNDPQAVDAEIQRIQSQIDRYSKTENSSNKIEGEGNNERTVANNSSSESDANDKETETVEDEVSRRERRQIEQIQEQTRINNEKNKAYAEAASIAAEGLGKGISEGIISGLSLSVGLRGEESETPDAILTAMGTTTFELGIQMGANSNSGFSVGYGSGGASPYDSGSSYLYVVGLDIGILNLLEFQNSYALQLSVGGEYGTGSGDYTDSNYNGDDTWDIIDDVSFYGGNINAKFMKYFIGGYGYGYANGSYTYDGETTDYDTFYSKVTLGLRIPF